MSKQHRFESINDVLSLDDEEFERFLPDFITWFVMMRDLVNAGAESVGMIWVDDGKTGQIHSVHLTAKDTGQETVIKGPAWNEENA